MAKPRKPKADKAPESAAPKESPPKAGHNQLTRDERQALHAKHVKEYETVLAAKKTADANLKNVSKRIKSEGGSAKLCKLTISLRTEEGTEAFKERLAQETEVAEWSGVGVQVDLFGDDGDDRTPAVDRAEAEGKRACFDNQQRKPPYAPSVPQYERWCKGYDAGQAVLASNFKPLTPKPDDDDRDLRPDALKQAEAERAGTVGTEPATHSVVQ